MSTLKFLCKVMAMTLIIASLTGCNAPGVTPALLPPPTQAQPGLGRPSLFKSIRTVQVTPDDLFLIGGFARIGYIPATDRFAVVFGTHLAHPSGGCELGAHAYKEYTADMEPTGKSGVLNCGVGDGGGTMVDNVYYDVSMYREGDLVGWRIIKYDAVTWKSLANIFYTIVPPKEGDGDPLVSYVNGKLDVASGYTEDAKPPPQDEGAASHHNFLSPGLVLQDKKRLSDTPHRSEGSIIYVDGVYSYVTSTSYTGDLIVMRYDQDWQYLGSKMIRKQAHFPTGVAFDGQRYYLAFLDTTQKNGARFFPYYPNVHLAAFDRDWNLMDDVAVTNFAPPGYMTGRPWVILHENRLYVSYDVAPLEAGTGKELLDQIEAYVGIYELVQGAP